MHLIQTGAITLILSTIVSSVALPDSDLYERSLTFAEDGYILDTRAEPSAWKTDLYVRDAYDAEAALADLLLHRRFAEKRPISRRDPILADGPGEAVRALADLISEKTNGCPWNNPGRAECERCKAEHNKKKTKREARGGGGGGRGGRGGARGTVKGGESSTCKQWGF